MSAMHRPLTKIVEFESRDISFRELEILPDLLQTRAETRVEVARKYSEAMAAGSKFPDVLVFLTPEGRFLLADGFHRVAARKSLGFKNIRAVIRHGTMEDAILAGIQANIDASDHVVLTAEDRTHAVEIMIRNEAMRGWSDNEISRRCGASGDTSKRARLRLRDQEGIALPEQISIFSNGKLTGRTARYRRASANSGVKPVVHRRDGSGFRAIVNGKRMHLGCDLDIAQLRLNSLLENQQATKSCLGLPDTFRKWLANREISVLSRGCGRLGGLLVRNSLVLPVAEGESTDAVLREIGRAVLICTESPEIERLILIGYFGSNKHAGYFRPLCDQLTPPIEFMTPAELVIAFGGVEPDAEPTDQEGVDA